MTLPKYLDVPVRDAISVVPTENWATLKAYLARTHDLDADILDKYAEDILDFRRDSAKGTSSSPIEIRPAGNLPATPPSSDTQGSPQECEGKGPVHVFLLVKGLNDSLETLVTGCEWSDDVENTITCSALETRSLISLVNSQTTTIKLSWYKPGQVGKVRTSLFRVVDDEEIPLVDIRFGMNWEKGAPMDFEPGPVGGQRNTFSGSQGHADVASSMNPICNDPVAIGVLMGNMVRTLFGGCPPALPTERAPGFVDEETQSLHGQSGIRRSAG